MFDWTSNNRDRTIGFGPLAGGVIDFKNQWFETLTGRVGYAVQPAWLLYVQGGAAWGHTKTDFTFGGVQFGERVQYQNRLAGWGWR